MNMVPLYRIGHRVRLRDRAKRCFWAARAILTYLLLRLHGRPNPPLPTTTTTPHTMALPWLLRHTPWEAQVWRDSRVSRLRRSHTIRETMLSSIELVVQPGTSSLFLQPTQQILPPPQCHHLLSIKHNNHSARTLRTRSLIGQTSPRRHTRRPELIEPTTPRPYLLHYPLYPAPNRQPKTGEESLPTTTTRLDIHRSDLAMLSLTR